MKQLDTAFEHWQPDSTATNHHVCDNNEGKRLRHWRTGGIARETEGTGELLETAKACTGELLDTARACTGELLETARACFSEPMETVKAWEKKDGNSKVYTI